MKTYGLIGYPLAQSFSYKYFTQKFKEEAIDARFLNFELENINEFKELLNHHAYIAGLSVTIPYKETVIPFLDELDETAKKIKAVNSIKITWQNKKATLIGYNTDVIGFSNSIRPLLHKHHKKALILGSGGAAKATAYAFERMNIKSKYVSRKDGIANSIKYSELSQEVLDEYTVIVNTTPLGMFPKVDTCPDIPYELLSDKHLLYDLTYNPDITLYMQKGLERGAQVKNGLDMLHLQAEASWNIWND
ncbi:shikimate dehydrogenase family protein [Carboxylicivirga sp. N1Y90]|uniref:shikimate dehydrogenase family protein n=1 Tax=Carboxylicivirga fragile TaxID=3417571 RepID=UPI003D3504F1|nr:shikimate dehydrogenase [Marinilabiliaceae bacterium N1Y90]